MRSKHSPLFSDRKVNNLKLVFVTDTDIKTAFTFRGTRNLLEAENHLLKAEDSSCFEIGGERYV